MLLVSANCSVVDTAAGQRETLLLVSANCSVVDAAAGQRATLLLVSANDSVIEIVGQLFCIVIRSAAVATS